MPGWLNGSTLSAAVYVAKTRTIAHPPTHRRGDSRRYMQQRRPNNEDEWLIARWGLVKNATRNRTLTTTTTTTNVGDAQLFWSVYNLTTPERVVWRVVKRKRRGRRRSIHKSIESYYSIPSSSSSYSCTSPSSPSIVLVRVWVRRCVVLGKLVDRRSS